MRAVLDEIRARVELASELSTLVDTVGLKVISLDIWISEKTASMKLSPPTIRDLESQTPSGSIVVGPSEDAEQSHTCLLEVLEK